MPCTDCQNRDKIIAELTASLEKRDQQLLEANSKLVKQKLQSKAKFAQLKHQILESVVEKGGVDQQKIVENLLSKLDETDQQLVSCREELDNFKGLLTDKETEIQNNKETIQSLENEIKHLEEVQSTAQFSNRPERTRSETDITSEEDEEDLHDRLERMYAQMVYKDSKIVELNDMIMRRDEKILDLQESCRERDEVIWAKTKAVQVFQEKLNFYANRDFQDAATETTAINFSDADAVGGPGRAVAFYRGVLAGGREDEESSTTTEAKIDPSNLLMAKFNELADSARNSSDGLTESAKSQLNAQLLDFSQQLEALQIKFATLEKFKKEQPKKKREKRVTFDFSSEQDKSELTALTDKLSRAEQASLDLKEENDDLRLTIADLEHQLSSYAVEMPKEDNDDLRRQLKSAFEQIDDLKRQLQDKDDHLSELERHIESLSGFIRGLERQLEDWQHAFADKESENVADVQSLQRQLRESDIQISRLMQQKEIILSDVDDLREAIETSQQVINGLETDLETSNSELENVRKTLENQRRENADMVASLQRDLTTQKLNAKAYETKFRSVEQENRRLSDLIEAQKQEWILLRSEGKDEKTGFRLKAKAYEAKFRILQDDNERLENLVVELKSMIETVQNEKEELTKEYERKLSEFEQEAKENLDLIERAMVEQKNEMEALKSEFNSQARLKTKAYEAKWRSIERENERLNESINEFKKSIDDRNEENQRLLDELSTLKQKYEKLGIEKQRMDSEINELNKALEKSERETSALRVEFEKNRAELTSKQAEYSTILDELNDAQSSMASVRSSLDNMTSKFHQAENQIRYLQDEKRDFESDVHRLWDVESNLKRRMNELERTNSQFQEENEHLKNRCSTAENAERKLEDLMSDHERLNQDRKKLKEKLEYLETVSSDESNRLANELQAFKDQVLKLEAINGELDRNLRDSKQRESDLSEDKMRLENLYANLMNELDSKKISVQTAGEQNEDLKTQLSAMRNEKEMMELKISDMENNLLDMSAEKTRVGNLYSNLIEEMEANKVSLQMAMQENADLKTQLDTLETKLKEVERQSVIQPSDPGEQKPSEIIPVSSNLDYDTTSTHFVQELEEGRTHLLEQSVLLQSNNHAEQISFNHQASSLDQTNSTFRIKDLEEERQRLMDHLTELNQERQKLGEERHNLCAEIVELNEKLSMTDLLVQTLKQDMETLVEENELLKTSMEEKGNENESKSNLIMELEKRNLEVQTSYQQLITYYTELQSAYSVIFQQYEELQKKAGMMVDAETETDSTLTKVNLSEIAVGTEDTLVPGAHGEVQSKDTASEQSRSELVKLKAKLRKMEKTMEALEAKNRYLHDENSYLEKKLTEHETRISPANERDTHPQEESASLGMKTVNLQQGAITTSGESGLVDVDLSMQSLVQSENQQITADAVQSQSSVFDEKLLDHSSTSHSMKDMETERKIAIALAEATGLRQHISILVEQIDTQKSKYDDLQQRYSASEFEKSHLQSKFNDISETVELLKQELIGVKQLFQTSDSENGILRRRLDELSSQEKELKEQLVERTNAFASLQTASTESNATMKNEMDELSMLNSVLKEELANVVGDRDRAQEKVRRLLASVDELEMVNHDLHGKIADLETHCSELELSPAVGEENAQLKARMQELMAMLQKWENQVGDMERTNENLIMENKRLGMEKEEQEKNLDDERKNLAEMMKKLEETKRAMEIVKKELSLSNDDNGFLRSILDELEEKNRQLQEEMDNCNAKYEEVQSLKDLVVYHKELEQRFQEETEKCDSMEKKLEILTADLTLSKENEKIALERLVLLEKQCDDLKLEIDEIRKPKECKENFTNTDLSMNDLDLVNQDLESTIQRLLSENEKLEHEKNGIKIQLEQYRTQLEEVQLPSHKLDEMKLANQNLLKEKEKLSEECYKCESRLREKCEELEVSLKRQDMLEKDVEYLTVSLESLTAEMKENEEKASNLAISLNSQNQELEFSKSVVISLEEKIKELSLALSMSNDELSKTKSDFDSVRSLYESLYLAFSQIENENTSLKAEMDVLKTQTQTKEIEWLEKEHNLKKDIETLESTKEELIKNLEKVKGQLDNLKEITDDDDRIKDSLTKEIEKARKTVQDLEMENQNLRFELSEKVEIIKDLKCLNERLVLDLKTKEALIAASEDTSCMEAKSKIEGLEMEKEQLTSKIEQHNLEIYQLNDDLQLKSDQISQVVKAFSKLGLDVEHLDDIYSSLESLVRERDLLSQLLLESTSKNDMLQIRQASLLESSSKLKDLEMENDQLTSQIDQHKLENDQHKLEIDHLNDRLKLVSYQYSQVVEAFSKLGLNVQNLDDICRCLETLVRERDVLNQLRSELASKTEMIHVTQASLFESTCKITDLEMEKEQLISQINQQKLEIDRSDNRLKLISDQDSQVIRAFSKLGLDVQNEDDIYRCLETLVRERDLLNRERSEMASKAEMIQVKQASFLESSRKIEDLEMEKDQLILQHKSEIDQLNRNLKSLLDQKSRMMEAFSGLGLNVKDLDEVYQSLEILVHERDALNRQLSSRISEFEMEKKQLLSEHHSEIDRLKGGLKSISDQNSQMMKAFSSLGLHVGNVNDVYQCLETLVHERDSLNRQRSELVSKIEMVQVTASEMENERKKCEDLEKECEQYRTSLKELEKRVEHSDMEINELKKRLEHQDVELDNAKVYIKGLEENIKGKEADYGQLNDTYFNLVQFSEGIQKERFEQEMRQQQAYESSLNQFAGAKEKEFRQEMARMQNEFAFELNRVQDDLSKAVKEKQEAIQWLDQERPKYVSALRNLGELKEQLAQQKRQLESYYLKLAELDVMKEQLREFESVQERLKSEKKELANQFEHLIKEKEAYKNQLTLEREELENLKRQRSNLEENHKGTSQLRKDGVENMGDNLSGSMEIMKADLDNVRDELQASEKRNSYLMARVRELEHQQTNWDRKSPSPDVYLDLESGSDHGDTISLMPMDLSNRSKNHDRSLQLRRETLGALSSEKSLFKSIQLWFRSKARKYPFFLRRRPNLSKLLLMIYLLTIHIFVFICWFH